MCVNADYCHRNDLSPWMFAQFYLCLMCVCCRIIWSFVQRCQTILFEAPRKTFDFFSVADSKSRCDHFNTTLREHTHTKSHSVLYYVKWKRHHKKGYQNCHRRDGDMEPKLNGASQSGTYLFGSFLSACKCAMENSLFNSHYLDARIHVRRRISASTE